MESSKNSNTNKAVKDLAKATVQEEDNKNKLEQPNENKSIATKTAQEIGL